jgi:hypothetical protein
MKGLLQISMIAIIGFLLIAADNYGQPGFQTGKMGVTINEYGRIRIFYPEIDNLVQIDRASWLMGVRNNQVFDYKNDAEAQDSSRLLETSEIGDYEIYGTYNNTYSGAPPNFLQKMWVYGWNDEAFILVKMTTVNQEGAAKNTIIGLEFIAQLDGIYGNEILGCIKSKQIVDVYGSKYVGFKFLGSSLSSFRAVDWYDNYFEGDTALFARLTYSKIDTMFATGGDGGVGTMAMPTVNIKSKDSTTVYLAISVGETQEEMETAMLAAENKFSTITRVSKEDSELPQNYNLKQNYPNPFNPTTNISFSLPFRQNVILKVYNSLGQLISTMVNSEYDAGNYTFDFNAANLSSGIYFYRLQAGSYTATRKMMLIK